MISAPVLHIPTMGHEAEFVVATDASKTNIVVCFYKTAPLYLKDHVLIGLGNLKI